MTQEYFGQRPSPSLAQAMYNGTPISPPNLQNLNQREFIDSYPNQIALHCSPLISDEYSRQSHQEQNFSQNNIPVQLVIKDIEKQVCEQLDSILKAHYKKIKAKIKKINEKTQETDISISKLSKILDTITETISSQEKPNPSQIILTPQINSLHPSEESNHQFTTKLSWQRSQTTSSNKRDSISKFNLESSDDDSFF